MALTVRATGLADPGVAWERYTRVELWPVWAPQIRGVAGVTGEIAAGDRGSVLGPGPVRVPFEILDVDPVARRWAWRVGLGPLGVEMRHGVDPAPTGATGWVEIRLPAIVAAPYAPVARWALSALVRE